MYTTCSVGSECSKNPTYYPKQSVSIFLRVTRTALALGNLHRTIPSAKTTRGIFPSNPHYRVQKIAFFKYLVAHGTTCKHIAYKIIKKVSNTFTAQVMVG